MTVLSSYCQIYFMQTHTDLRFKVGLKLCWIFFLDQVRPAENFLDFKILMLLKNNCPPWTHQSHVSYKKWNSKFTNKLAIVPLSELL